MSEVSITSEEINPSLLTDETFRVVLLDGSTSRLADEIFIPINIKSKFDLDLTQFIPNSPLQIDQMPEFISNLIDDVQDKEGVSSDKRIKLVRHSQPDLLAELGNEVITYRILSRKPANMSTDGRSRPNRLPSYSYEYINALEPNKVLYIESRPLDHILEISTWAKSITLADKRALWLERLLISHRWMFTSRGVKPFFFEGRSADTMWNPNVRLHQVPMRFFARIQEFNILALPTIKQFDIIVDSL